MHVVPVPHYQAYAMVSMSMTPRVGTLVFTAYVGWDPASTVHPLKIPGISSTPKKYLEFWQPQKISPILFFDLKKRP